MCVGVYDASGSKHLCERVYVCVCVRVFVCACIFVMCEGLNGYYGGVKLNE